MPKVYGKDIRELAVRRVLRGEERLSVSKDLEIGVASLNRWLSLHRKGGDLEGNKRSDYGSKKVCHEKLKEVLSATPDATLEELSEPFSSSKSTIFYHLKKLNITYKKNTSL